MRKSKAKQSIITTAQKLIEKKGYAELNVNEVAYVAKVSVGTLYYHFPKGKIDILAEIMSTRLEEFVENFGKQMQDENIIKEGMGLEDALRMVIKKVLEVRKTDRHFLLAIQSEMLANPDEYEEFVEKYQTSTGLQQAMGALSEILLAADLDMKKLASRQQTIQRLVGLLLSYQIMFPGYFGNDDQFVELATSIFLDILQS